MIRYASTRGFAALLFLFCGALAPAPTPVAAQTPASTGAKATFNGRLERLATEIEQSRVDLHAPGVALVVVRGDDVVFARGFGFADIENRTPVTPETPFFIGSTTKAFTATLVGMLVDEGLVSWDDPVDRYLPYFTLAVDSEDPQARATMRDILSHRTGFPRMALLGANGTLSSEGILRQASFAEPFAPFRERFYYNNVQYLAAGWAAAAAAGEPSGELIDERILTPLGMDDTRTSMREARRDADLAHGYSWDETLKQFRVVPASPESPGVDPVAPAGSISSTGLDMARWIRFLLSGGSVGGKRLIGSEALTTTWTAQIRVGEGVGYGMGWFVRDWRGQRFIEHGGNVRGFSSQVGLLPESDLGFVLLTNGMSTSLPAFAVNRVPEILLGQLPEPGAERVEIGDLGPYLGRYVANFASFSNEVFTILAGC